MTLIDIISLKCIEINSESKNQDEILQEIAGIAKRNPKLDKLWQNDIFNALKKREDIGSTGFENSIAIPHCSFDDLDDFVVGLLINKDGIDFKSIDGSKSKIFFFIIGPTNQRNKHIRILSAISRFLKSKKNIKRVLEAPDVIELTKIISESPNLKDENVPEIEKVLFHVFIQKEEYFDDILQILSEVVDGSISVIETINAGYFLHQMPIFSTFWSENKKSYNRIIIAVVDKKRSNNVIRRINTIVPEIENEFGVMITANELFYTNGQINF